MSNKNLNFNITLHKHCDSDKDLKSQLLFWNFERNQNAIADALKGII